MRASENSICWFVNVDLSRLYTCVVMSNAPDRYLSWRWEDEAEAERLVYQPDSKKPNAGTFVMKKEDHTIGNLLRMQMLRDPSVRFAGYRLPHPLIMECHVRVETMDSKLTPPQVCFYFTEQSQ